MSVLLLALAAGSAQAGSGLVFVSSDEDAALAVVNVAGAKALKTIPVSRVPYGVLVDD